MNKDDKIVSPEKKPARQIISIWLFMRVLTALAATAFSPLRPITEIEKKIALWPPTGDILAWFNRAFIAPWNRWDAEGFTQIVTQGYAAWNGMTSFHPLYPLLSIPLYRLGVDPVLSLLITSTLAALGLLFGFQKLARLDLSPDESTTAMLCLVLCPVSFILFATYTESLFLLLAVLVFYFSRLNRPLLAAAAAFLAALTRQQGLFLVIPMAWWAWEASGRSVHGFNRSWRAWLALLAAPAGLLVWGIYRIGFLHEGTVNFHDLQGLVYSALISPSAHQVVEVQAFLWPWEAIKIAIVKLIQSPDTDIVINLVFGISFITALAVTWRHMNIAYRLYSLAITIISFSLTTGSIHPYISLPRHLLLAVPVFLGLGAVVKKPWTKRFLFGGQIFAQVFLIYCFVLKGWIP